MNIYDELYDPQGVNYGGFRKNTDYATNREKKIFKKCSDFLERYEAKDNSLILEIGCGLGFNHKCHSNYLGIEYSSTAINNAKNRFGIEINLRQGDATNLNITEKSIDFLFTFSALEHIPDIHSALKQIDKVLKIGGFALIAPAWNCRIWTVQKLKFLNYNDLSLRKKIAKFLIPLRENIFFRLTHALPKRLLDEIKLIFGIIPKLRFQKLPVDLELIRKFGHVSDDDAFIDIDAHSAITFYKTRGYQIISHPSFLSRVFCRGEGIIVRKN